MKTINKVILSPADRNCSGSQPCKQRDLEQRQLKMTGTFGFTLVELLVVVLIIGILSAVAIPMYQGAVDKSHWSTMLPGAKALKDAEEAVRMSNGLYTANMDNLDVRMPNGDVQYTLETVNDDGTANVVRAINSKLGDKVRLSNYLDENTFFGGQLHCEAKDNDERATRLCEKLLGGQELNTVGGYTRYLLDQSIDQATCGAAEKSWSTSKTTCYKDDTTRCEALGGMQVISDGQCGFINTINGKKLGAEGKCLANGSSDGCNNITIEKGGVCELNSTSSVQGCRGLTVDGGIILCKQGGANCGSGGTTITNGGACVDLYAHTNCYDIKLYNSSICYANTFNGCRLVNYDSTSCCCGKGCPSDAPKCADRGITCDPQYLK